MPAWHDAWATGPVRDVWAVALGHDVSAAGLGHDVSTAGLDHDVSTAGLDHDVSTAGLDHDVSTVGLDRDVSAAGPVRDVSAAGPVRDAPEGGPGGPLQLAVPAQKLLPLVVPAPDEVIEEFSGHSYPLEFKRKITDCQRKLLLGFLKKDSRSGHQQHIPLPWRAKRRGWQAEMRAPSPGNSTTCMCAFRGNHFLPFPRMRVAAFPLDLDVQPLDFLI